MKTINELLETVNHYCMNCNSKIEKICNNYKRDTTFYRCSKFDIEMYVTNKSQMVETYHIKTYFNGKYYMLSGTDYEHGNSDAIYKHLESYISLYEWIGNKKIIYINKFIPLVSLTQFEVNEIVSNLLKLKIFE